MISLLFLCISEFFDMFHVEHILRSYIFMSQPQLNIFCKIKIVLRGTISRKQTNVSRGTNILK